jgi:acyl dehydratase
MLNQSWPFLDESTMPHYLDELEIGRKLTTASRTVTAEDVDAFARLTGDLNPVHLDEEYARRSIFGQRVVHGAFTVAVAAGLLSPLLAESTIAAHGIDQLRFRRPVYLGDTLRVTAKLTGIERQDETAGILRMRCQVINQRGKVVMLGTFSVLMKRRAEADASES